MEEPAAKLPMTGDQAEDWRRFLKYLRTGDPDAPSGAEDRFIAEGRQAYRDGAGREECPHNEGTDGENGWHVGYAAEAEADTEQQHGSPRV